VAIRTFKAFVGIDVGGTFTKMAAVTEAGRVRLEEKLPSQVEAGPASFVDRVSGVVERWIEQGLRPLGAGLGLAGDVDSRRGELRFTPNLGGWDGFPFKRALERRLKTRVVVDNDANAAVWGGYVAELKRKPRDVVGITLGTGVGGGLVLGGRLHRGATGSAGEIGHTKVAPGGELCHCGGRGCLEAYAGSYGILRLAKRLLEKDGSRGRRLLEISGGADKLEPAHLSKAADAGDPIAQEVWVETGRKLAVGLENLILVLNPDVVLILGGVSRAGRWLLDPIEAHLAAQPFRTAFSRARVKMADNPNAGCVGAALLAKEA
jgi:glucokinase